MDDITAEYAVDQLVPHSELRFRPRVTIAAKTDLGRVRENNEDKYEFYCPEDDRTLASRGQVFIVCDGMGGHAAGQIASELAVKTFLDTYLHHPAEDPTIAMHAAVQAANRWVLDNARAFPQRRGMGTTLSVLILLQDEAHIVQVGDSRVYLLREGKLRMITTDHTWVEEAVKMGMITAEEAEHHQYKHVLTRAIGNEDGFMPDLFREPLQTGDLYFLCSDGVMNHVADATIEEALNRYAPADAAFAIVNSALLGGGSDNTTVVIVRVDELVANTTDPL